MGINVTSYLRSPIYLIYVHFLSSEKWTTLVKYTVYISYYILVIVNIKHIH